MERLLTAEEEKIRGEIRADTTVDKSKTQSVARLNETMSQILLRYNAANGGNWVQQNLADCLTATMQDSLGFLLAGTAEKEISKRPLQTGAVIALLCSVICCLASLLLIVQKLSLLFGCILLVMAVLLAFLSGRLWFGEREVRVPSRLDADTVWRTLKKASATMDRKIETFCEAEDARLQEAQSLSCKAEKAKLSEEELQLFGALLEGLYSGNGDFSLRQLQKIKLYLRHLGIELREYNPENAELFEILPSRKGAATLRPALLDGETLLLPGKATDTEP